MSEPFVRPIPTGGEPQSTEWVWPSRAAGAAPKSAEAQSDSNPQPAEPDHMELSSGSSSYAVFSVQPKTGLVSIKIIDSKTDQVIRQIPSEEILHIAEQVQSYLARGRAHAKSLGVNHG